MVSEEKPTILLTFDVEDWFQVENLKPAVPLSAWDAFPLRVEQNTNRILAFLDEFDIHIQATFFVLGWVARRFPNLVRQIANLGHEVASHGFGHQTCPSLGEDQLFKDLVSSKRLLEDILGQRVHGYRAPSFSVNEKVIELVRRAGYRYDASFNSFASHGRYGNVSLRGFKENSGIYSSNFDFHMVPVSNWQMGQFVFPLGGGGYFRLLPFDVFKYGMTRVIQKQGCFVFYAHPWEFDPDQPRIDQMEKVPGSTIPLWHRFRHYVNLGRTETKMAELIRSFSGVRYQTIRDYINAH